MVIRAKVSRAFTLVELLVVVAIIGVLIGLLLPAVQAAREAARRSTCSNKVKQLGLALLNHLDARQTLPAAGNWSYNGIDRPATGFDSAAAGPDKVWNVDILPFIERSDLYDQLDLTKATYDTTTSASKPVSNRSLLEFKEMPFQACPSNTYALGCKRKNQDGQTHTGFNGNPSYSYFNWAVGCYGVCAGPNGVGNSDTLDCALGFSASSWCLPLNNTVYKYHTADKTPGMFGIQAPFLCRPKDVPDGLSKTLMICEKRGELMHHGGVWSGRKQGVPTGLRINSPSIVETSWNEDKNGGAASYHPNGAMFCLGDGAVRFLTNAIDFEMYNALGGRNDGKAASAD